MVAQYIKYDSSHIYVFILGSLTQYSTMAALNFKGGFIMKMDTSASLYSGDTCDSFNVAYGASTVLSNTRQNG